MKYNVGHYIPRGDWPPNSPDLSPIENVWSVKAAAIYEHNFMPLTAQPQTMTALERRLRKPWRSLSLTTVQNLIGSMPDRLKAVIRNKRDIVPY